MTRIIAGAAGSLTLSTPAHGTRPTSDRVREALFSSLEAQGVVAGATVADLYAGSGALGLEALSRGAQEATLVESNRAAARICRRNASAVAHILQKPAATVAAVPVARWLRTAHGMFDLLFVDPPYALENTELADNLTGIASLMAPNGLVIVERSVRTPEPMFPAALVLVRSQRYGETILWTAQAVAPNSVSAEAPAQSGR